MPAAISAENGEQALGSAELIYREEEETSAPDRTAQNRAGGKQTQPEAKTDTARPTSETPHVVTVTKEKQSTRPDRDSEAALQESTVGEPALPAALPLEGGEPAPGGVELVYLENAGTAEAGPEERRQEPVRPDKHVPAVQPEAQAAEGAERAFAAALPAQPGNDEAVRPIALHLRTEGDVRPVAGRIARDIRVTAEHERIASSQRNIGFDRSGAAANPTAGRDAVNIAVSRSGAEAGEASQAVPVPAAEETQAPPDLIFAPPAYGAVPPEEGNTARPAQQAREDRTENLPSWAKDLLEKSGVTDTVQQTNAFRGRFDQGSGVRQIEWTAPGAGTAQRSRSLSEPAEMTFKERGEPEDTVSRPQISEAEIERTADKVYRIIEERLRRELRRSGR